MIMKKTYMSPDTLQTLISAQAVLIGASQNPDGFSENLDDDNPIETKDMLSRRRNVWDDEEEEGKEDF